MRQSECKLHNYYRSGKTKFFVPKFDNWNKITKGMSPKDVAKLIGKPLIESPVIELPNVISWKIYGYIKIADPMFPHDIYFMVEFDDQNVVYSKSCIWGTSIPVSDKIPSPKIVNSNNQVFDHYPRFVDIRWLPIPYAKPVSYEIEMSWHCRTSNMWSHQEDYLAESDIPFKTICFLGAQKGFVRIRAVDRKSQERGEWSEPFYFEFTG